MKLRDDCDCESESLIPNLTPVIDVMVLLLIFYVGVSEFKSKVSKKERDVSIEIPKVVDARPLAAGNKQIVVNVNQRGEFKVSGEPYTFEQLADYLKLETFKNPDMQTVQIRADERVAFRYPIQVMGLCEQNNIKHTCAVDLVEEAADKPGANP